MDEADIYNQAAQNYRSILNLRRGGAVVFIGVFGVLLNLWFKTDSFVSALALSIVGISLSAVFLKMSFRWQDMSDEQLSCVSAIERKILDSKKLLLDEEKFFPFIKRSDNSSQVCRWKKVNSILGCVTFIMSSVLLPLSLFKIDIANLQQLLDLLIHLSSGK